MDVQQYDILTSIVLDFILIFIVMGKNDFKRLFWRPTGELLHNVIYKYTKKKLQEEKPSTLCACFEKLSNALYF